MHKGKLSCPRKCKAVKLSKRDVNQATQRNYQKAVKEISTSTQNAENLKKEESTQSKANIASNIFKLSSFSRPSLFQEKMTVKH